MKPKPSSPAEHYQHEKERRANGAKPQNELLEDAKREYLAMLEAAATKGKGGRPKKAKQKPVEAKADRADEELESPEE